MSIEINAQESLNFFFITLAPGLCQPTLVKYPTIIYQLSKFIVGTPPGMVGSLASYLLISTYLITYSYFKKIVGLPGGFVFLDHLGGSGIVYQFKDKP